MQSEQVRAVQQSFGRLRPRAATVAAAFYERLFALDPTVRSLFTGDLQAQGQKLMQMLGMAVMGLRELDKLGPVLEDLGKRHGGYGVKAEHYPTVGAALLGTLEQELGEDFTPPLRAAWTEAYGLVAQVMQDAAASAV